MGMTAACPVCSLGTVLPDGTQEGELVRCSECRNELEVMSDNPYVLGIAP